MSDFAAGKKISFMLFMKYSMYTLVAPTWHHIEGKDSLPNLRLHVKEVAK